MTRFKGTVLDGHKGTAIELPFDPEERWSIPAAPLRKGRRGHRVRGTLNGVAFESEVVPRMRRFYLAVPDDVGLEIGEDVAVVLEPLRTGVAGAPRRAPAKTGSSYETVRELARALPNVEESTSYGTPALKVKKKLLARLKEDGETLVLRVSFDERDILMNIDAETFFITDHYLGYPAVLAKLPRLGRRQLQDVLEMSYRYVVSRASARRS